MKTNIIQEAEWFANNAHRGQFRKYTNEPYINHPMAVAEIIKSLGYSEEIVSAALLHDVVEDCNVPLEEIKSRFGERVADLVEMVTDVSKHEHGNRAIRKEIDKNHIARADHYGKTIKLADLIHNTMSITKHDKSFAKIYLQEKERLLEVLGEGNKTLFTIASLLVKENKT